MAEITIYTIAKELNMTPSMVSRAFNPNGRINEEKRRLVLETAERYGFVPNKFASRLSMKTVTIGVLINSRFNINTDKMISGVKTAYEKLKDYKIKYDITVMNSLVNEQSDYVRVLHKYKNCDGIILTGMSSAKYTDIINTLYKANPNIVQVQAVNESADYLFASKHNEEISSHLAAEFLYNCLKRCGRKNILFFTGDKNSALHSNARTSFKEACEKLELNILDIVDMKDNENYFTKIIPEIFGKYGNETDGIYITSGFSTPLCYFIEKNNIDIPFVAFDTHSDIKAYMEKGIISATIAQNVANQMEGAFEMLVKHLITSEQCLKTIYTDVQLVLKSNMNQFN